MAKKQAVQSTEATSPTPAEELEQIRARLVEVDAERRRIEAAPPPLAEVQTRIREYIEQTAARWAPNLSAFMSAAPVAAGSFRLFALPGNVRDHDALELRLEAYEYALRGGEAYAKLVERLAAEWPDAESLTTEERRVKLLELADERTVLELLEEACIRRAARLGIELHRRSDARPAVFLGDIDDLPDAAA